MDYTIIVSLDDKEIGTSEDIDNIFQDNGVSVTSRDSRPTRQKERSRDFLYNVHTTENKIAEIFEEMKKYSGDIRIKSARDFEDVPWFPTKIQELDKFSNSVISIDLPPDHPGFSDEEYQKRRKLFVDIASNYKQGQPIPRVEYTDDETKTWGTLYRAMRELHKTHACSEVNNIFPSLIEHCGYREDNIPQLEDVSQFLKSRTGFTVRPVAGFLNSRDFLAGLAFKVFHSTQYIRHWTNPHYTPEPDACHELLGHIPMFANPSFAKFSHEIGLASLGASDEDIGRLATCYVFTVEFGICKENDGLKAFGAGLLSSSGELQYAISEKADMVKFEPEAAAAESYMITDYQKVYFVSDSIEDAKNKVISFAKAIPKDFGVGYDADSEMITVKQR